HNRHRAAAIPLIEKPLKDLDHHPAVVLAKIDERHLHPRLLDDAHQFTSASTCRRMMSSSRSVADRTTIRLLSRSATSATATIDRSPPRSSYTSGTPRTDPRSTIPNRLPCVENVAAHFRISGMYRSTNSSGIRSKSVVIILWPISRSVVATSENF